MKILASIAVMRIIFVQRDNIVISLISNANYDIIDKHLIQKLIFLKFIEGTYLTKTFF